VLMDLGNLERNLLRGTTRLTGRKLKKLRKRGIGIMSLLMFTLDTTEIYDAYIRNLCRLLILRIAEGSGSGANLEQAKLLLLELNMLVHSMLKPRINGGMATQVSLLSFLMTSILLCFLII